MTGSSRTDHGTASNRRRGGVGLALLAAGVLLSAYHVFVRPWVRTWGATDAEVRRSLPGDEFVTRVSNESTRAVTVSAPSEAVWPWIAQLGQGRGGFYSYSWLENLVGADIHNVDRIVPELQRVEEGETIRLVREDYWLQSPITSMTVAHVDPGRTLVLQGHDGGTWTFHLEALDDDTTRLIVRGRLPEGQSPGERAVRYVLFEPIHFVMERRMLLGIEARAERDGRRETEGRRST